MFKGKEVDQMIKIDNLTKLYSLGKHGTVKALDNVSFSVTWGCVSVEFVPSGLSSTTKSHAIKNIEQQSIIMILVMAIRFFFMILLLLSK